MIVSTVIVFMVVIVVFGGGCVQSLIRSFVRRYLVCFRHFTRVQINAFRWRP
jgi:hypothetical protein